MSCLPEEVQALIAGLGPGERVVLGRGAAPVAEIRGLDEPRVGFDDGFDDVTVVATAMKLSASARRALSGSLGEGYIVLDMHAAPATADVVLVPPSSPQLIGGLRSMFPDARIVIAEVEDDVLGVSYRGPVHRMLDAGAEVYLPPVTIPRLAGQLDRVVTERRGIAGAGVRRAAAISPSESDVLPEERSLPEVD